MLRFKTLPTLPGFIAYGAKKTGFSYMVSFDENHPRFKWRASVKDADRKTVYLPGPFDSKAEAVDACEAKHRSLIQ